MIPLTTWSHQRSNCPFVMKPTIRSNVPLKIRKKAISSASVVNAACGWTSAQMPTPMKSTPRIPWTHFQPVVDTLIATNSFIPAASAMKPNRNETAYTVV